MDFPKFLQTTASIELALQKPAIKPELKPFEVSDLEKQF